mgnify:CR=1 FL=1
MNPQSSDSARIRHIGPIPKRLLYSSAYAAVNAVSGSGLAAEKADAVVNISFARLNYATPARKLFNSAIASSGARFVFAATVTSDWLRQRLSDSGAIPRSFATCPIAFVSDEYEPRDSVNSLMAFALNPGVYLVPFAMVPSSPIELEEIRNKKQFISEPQRFGGVEV